ncbi:MAG: HDOD domain-containing protein [Psychrobium sp.]
MLELSEFVTKANKLYTLPDICLQLNSLVNSKNSSVDDIACLVGHDPALTFRVLKLANSALYSRKGNISTIDDAIQKIGTDELCNIAIATSAALVFKGAGRNKINLKNYWQHSVFTAIIARELYQLKSKRKEGSMFVAGLLHNIGFLIVLERLPYYMVKLADVVGEEHKERGFEKETLGFTFVDISSELLKKWQLGDDLIDLVTNQFSAHSSENNQLKCSCLNAAIDISDQVFETSQIKSMPLIQHISDEYQLDLDADALNAVIDRSVENVHNIVKIIQG